MKYKQLLVTGFIFFRASLGAVEPNPSALNLTIEEYVKRTLTISDRAITLFNNFENSQLGYKVGYRQTRFPTINLGSSLEKSKSDVDNLVTRTQAASGSASLSQPVFLTGGKLAAEVDQSFSLARSSDVLETRTYTRPEYRLSYTQPLYLFTGNSDWRTWKRSEINFTIAKNNYQRDLQQLENEARNSYFNVLLKSEELAVEKIKLESSKRSLAVTRALVEAGRLAGIEQSRSEINYQRDIRRLQNAETTFKQALNDALRFASIKIDAPVNFITKLTYQSPNVNLERLMAYALSHRPDYLAAQRQMELSKLSLRETLEANNPKLDAVVSYRKADTGVDSLLSAQNSWSGIVNLNWLFFDSRITDLQAESAKNNLENEKINLNNLERTIRTEVTNAVLELKRTEEQLEDLKSSKDQVRKSVEAVRVRYQNGRDRLIDVFNSEQELRDTEREYLSVIVSANTAKDRLAVLIGGRIEDVAHE